MSVTIYSNLKMASAVTTQKMTQMMIRHYVVTVNKDFS